MAKDMGPLKINADEIRNLLNGGNGMAEVLRGDAQRVLNAAIARAPVGKGTANPGAYKRSLHITTYHTDRLVYAVVADVPYAHIVEHYHGVLTRALGASLNQRGRTIGKTTRWGKAG
jgi:hypothetical protein